MNGRTNWVNKTILELKATRVFLWQRFNWMMVPKSLPWKNGWKSPNLPSIKNGWLSGTRMGPIFLVKLGRDLTKRQKPTLQKVAFVGRLYQGNL